ncbi:MAG: hypothetical protein GEU94_14020 [Micromonosporaceae bacterium]|nr:hypothetical protein [Micromonosporaceae bacterium]
MQDDHGRAKHEVDVIAVNGENLTLLGQAKATLAARSQADLSRLEMIKDVLTRRGYDTSDTILALFAAAGFNHDLRRAAATRGDVELIDLTRLYTGQIAS